MIQSLNCIPWRKTFNVGHAVCNIHLHRTHTRTHRHVLYKYLVCLGEWLHCCRSTHWQTQSKLCEYRSPASLHQTAFYTLHSDCSYIIVVSSTSNYDQTVVDQAERARFLNHALLPNSQLYAWIRMLSSLRLHWRITIRRPRPPWSFPQFCIVSYWSELVDTNKGLTVIKHRLYKIKHKLYITNILLCS